MRRRATSPARVSASTARSAIDRSFGVQVEPGARRLLEMKRDRARIPVDERGLRQLVGDPEVQPLALTLGERVVGDVAEQVGAESPHAVPVLVGQQELLVLGLGEQRGVRIRDQRELRGVEAAPRKHRGPPHQLAGRRGELVDPCRDHGLDGRGKPQVGRRGAARRHRALLPLEHPRDLDDEQRIAARVGRRSAPPRCDRARRPPSRAGPRARVRAARPRASRHRAARRPSSAGAPGTPSGPRTRPAAARAGPP